MNKNIKEFKAGELIRLSRQCGWVEVAGDAFVDGALVYMHVYLLGLMHTQLLVFNESETFEYQEGREE